VFEGIVGYSYESDMAVDEVFLLSGHCPISQKDIYVCTSDESDCGYTNDNLSEYDWKQESGGSKPTTTGPETDHTLGSKAG